MLTSSLRTRNRRHRRAQSGQVIVLTSLVFVFVLVGLIAAVGDLLVEENAAARVRDAAFLAAQSGGSRVDIRSASQQDVAQPGQLNLSGDAKTFCEQAVGHAAPGSTATCTTSGGTVTVDVSQQVALPLQLFGSSVTVHAHAQGGPAIGTVATP